MSPALPSRSPDLQQLRNEGYEISATDRGHLVLRDVPYVNSQRQLRYAEIISKLTLAGEVTATPVTDHVVFWTGEAPCDQRGVPLPNMVNPGQHQLEPGLTALCTFSCKPETSSRPPHASTAWRIMSTVGRSVGHPHHRRPPPRAGREASCTTLSRTTSATAVTFAIGLGTSLEMVTSALSHRAEQVEIDPAARPTFDQTSQRAVSHALLAQPATLHSVAEADETVSIAGMSQAVPITAFRGDAHWIGYVTVSGRWYTDPDEIDVASGVLRVTGKSVGDTLTLYLNGRQIQARIVGSILDTTNNGISMISDWRTLATVDSDLAPNQYDIQLRPGASVMAYTQAMSDKLGSTYSVDLNGLHSDVGPVVTGMITILTLLLALVAALGVLNTVVLQTRERVHDLGVFKAVGMTPAQTIAMIVSWVAGVGLIAGVVGVPAGIALHRYVLPIMASGAGGALPATFVNVYGTAEMASLVLAGVVIAVAGALVPASWAAHSSTAAALRAE